MPQVTYNGNGNTGGSPPVDTNNYAAGAPFTVAGPGSLSQGTSRVAAQIGCRGKVKRSGPY